MSDQTSISSLKQWCKQAKALVGGDGGGDDVEVVDSGELIGKLKTLLSGKPPFNVTQELWDKHKEQITQGFEDGILTEDDVNAGQLKDVLKGTTELSDVFTKKRTAIDESQDRMEALGINSVGKTVLFGVTDIKATLTKAETLKADFAKQVKATLAAVKKACTPAYGGGGPSEDLMGLWDKTERKAYETLQKDFPKALQTVDLGLAQSLLSQMTQLSGVFERNLSKILNFKRGKGEGLEGDELIELSDLDRQFQDVMNACRTALSEVKAGRTRGEIDALKKRFEQGKSEFDRTSARNLPTLAEASDTTTGSLAFFRDLEMKASEAAAPVMSEKEKKDWDSVCKDVKKTYNAFKATNYQARGLRGVFMSGSLRSDFMNKQFRLGRSHRIDGVLYTVSPSDTGSTSLHAPIPKNLQWYNTQGKLAKSFIYHY